MLLGTGSTITFASGFVAELLSVEIAGISRAAIPAHHMGTTGAWPKLFGKTFDPGRLEVEMAFAAQTTPPFVSAAETVTLEVPSAGTGGTSTWAASGALVEFGASIPLEDRQTARAVIELAGTITITP